MTKDNLKAAMATVISDVAQMTDEELATFAANGQWGLAKSMVCALDTTEIFNRELGAESWIPVVRKIRKIMKRPG